MTEFSFLTEKNFWQTLAWVAAVVGGGVAAWKAISELRQSRIQRARELAWTRARESFAMIDALKRDEHACTAMIMLDYLSNDYKLPSGVTVSLTRDAVLHGLRVGNTHDLSKADEYIRKCFDNFFDHVEKLQSAIDADLVNAEVLRESLRYFFDSMNPREVYLSYMTRYYFPRAIKFANEVMGWRD